MISAETSPSGADHRLTLVEPSAQQSNRKGAAE
jgi:hypothetical protein